MFGHCCIIQLCGAGMGGAGINAVAIGFEFWTGWNGPKLQPPTDLRSEIDIRRGEGIAANIGFVRHRFDQCGPGGLEVAIARHLLMAFR